MHLHSVNVTLSERPTVEAGQDVFRSEPRIALVPAEASVESCGHLRNFARDVGRPRGDLWENALWAESLTVHGRDLYFFQAIHQESDVVPENVDAVRALTETAAGEKSRRMTNRALGVGTLTDPLTNSGDDRTPRTHGRTEHPPGAPDRPLSPDSYHVRRNESISVRDPEK